MLNKNQLKCRVNLPGRYKNSKNSNSFKIAQKPLLRQKDDYTPQAR